MYDVILFAGTDEGHKIADFLREKNISRVICVATEYGALTLGGDDVRTGRMNAEDMREFFRESGAKIVIDATHPYAVNVTRNIKSACECRYVRVARTDDDVTGARFKTAFQAAAYLAKKDGNILVTTGSKEISEFSSLGGRVYARVLPSEESLRSCRAAGILPKNIICMQGPFSKELNAALIREYDIKFLVTKSGGVNGGFYEKADAARENGAELIVIDRPSREDGVSVEDAKKMISEWL